MALHEVENLRREKDLFPLSNLGLGNTKKDVR